MKVHLVPKTNNKKTGKVAATYITRDEMEYQGMTFQAWPEHGCWYEKGRANQVGAMHIPMGVIGAPVFDDMGEVEVLWEEA